MSKTQKITVKDFEDKTLLEICDLLSGGLATLKIYTHLRKTKGKTK